MIRFSKYTLPILLFFIASSIFAQDMVKDGGQDGLMKTVTYDVSRFTDIRDKKLSDVMMKMPGLLGTTFSGGETHFSYNGMSVARIYVNGLDVLEGNSQPVYNLKPEDVECLEITENHVSIKIMKGKQYSNSASINVILKDSAKGKWSGSAKAMAGGSPLLGTTDVNGLKLGPKVQTTVMFKADNTGLDFTGPLHGYGDYGDGTSDKYNEDAYAGIEGVSGGFDYCLRKFLDVEPSLAPLSSERVRFNRSTVAQIGNTYKLSENYQLNVQVTLHANRLKANSLDETTYYMGQDKDVEFLTDETAKLHQYDIQTSATLLSNTETQFLRNQLIFNHRRIDMLKDITGTQPNVHDMNTYPIYLKNDFHIKRLVGENVLSINAMAGYNTRPQELILDMPQENDGVDQKIKASSGYVDLGAKLDIALANNVHLSLNAGGAYNGRTMDFNTIFSKKNNNISKTSTELTILNAFGGATLTYISDKMQAELGLPINFANYDYNYGLQDHSEWDTQNDSEIFFAPKINIKYDITAHFSVSGDLAYNQNPLDRKRIYYGKAIQDFKSAVAGYQNPSKNKTTKMGLAATYRNPEHSFFVNGSIDYNHSKDAYIYDMINQDGYMTRSYKPAPKGYYSKNSSESIDINKGIAPLKGKIGLSLSSMQSKYTMVRGDKLMPSKYNFYSIEPYVNGRLLPWMNMIYKLSYVISSMQMEGFEKTSTQNYTQSLELIFSPWEKLNFSLLGEHYYTEFSDNQSKHLVLADFKAEYNLSDKWQLLLTATNILNQDTYNYTLVDSDNFTRSFTSYGIRPRNILLGIFYKF